jgi:hypothetical protein
MDVLRLFLMAAFSIKTVASLPQDWSIFDPSDSSPYELTTYPDSFELASVPLDSSLDFGEVLYSEQLEPDEWYSGTGVDGIDPLGGELPWVDDLYDNSPPDLFAAGCSGAIGKRNDEAPPASCPPASSDESSTESAEEPAEDPNCGPDKQPTCCDGTYAFRSRWGGGLNVGLCGPFISVKDCFEGVKAADGSVIGGKGTVQCCDPDRNLLSVMRWGCTTADVTGNWHPSPKPPPSEKPALDPPLDPAPQPIPAPEVNPVLSLLPNEFYGF